MKTSAVMRAIDGASPQLGALCNDMMLIEQDELLRRKLSPLLSRYCRNFFSFESLEPACLHLKQQGFPSVIVTDLYLPEGRSIELISESLGKSEVIVISSLVSQEEAFLLGKMGVKSYLAKPVDTQRLHSALEQALLDRSLERGSSSGKLAINTFGGLSIAKNGCEIRFSRKTPYKILEFIACILSFGARNVPVSMICDQLWPDAEGDRAEKNFTACLRRARDLVDPENADVLLRQAGKVSLNPDRVMVDVWCLEKLSRAGGDGVLTPYSKAHFFQDWLPEYDGPWLIQSRKKYKKMAEIFNA